MVKVLVTGASGFIGSTLVQQLSEDPRVTEVRALLRATSSRENLAGLQFVEARGSLGDRESLVKAMAGVDVVFHLAGVTAATTPEGFMRANAQGTELVGKAALESGVKRVIYVSSLAAGGPATRDRERQEADPPQPVSLYGRSKLEGERRLLETGVPCTIVRPPMVYGPKDRDVLVIIKTVAKRLAPRIEGPGGEKSYSIIHSEDLCEALRFVASQEVPSGEVFYVGESRTYAYEAIIGSMAKGLGVRPLGFVLPQGLMKVLAQGMGLVSKITGQAYPLNPDKFHEIAVDHWTCSTQKIRSLGWEARIPLVQGMKDTIQWYRERQWL